MIVLFYLNILRADPPNQESLTAQSTKLVIDGNQITGSDLALSQGPLKIQSQDFQVNIKNGETLFKNSVTVEHPHFTLLAQALKLSQNEDNEQEIVATGSVEIQVMDRFIQANKAVYWPKQDRIVLSSSVVARSKDHTMRGEVVEIVLYDQIHCKKECSIEWQGK